MPQNMPSLDFDEMMTQNFIFTFNYIFSAINVTTKKYDMVRFKIYYIYNIFLLSILIGT